MEENTMKTEELRIGNIVWEDYSGEMIVFGLVTGGINPRAELRKTEKLPAGSYHIDTLKGIPLTPEWLQRMGFDIEYPEHETSNYNYLAVCSWLKISSSKKSESPAVLLRGPGTLTELPHIKFIHEIQNLYFALTGEELTLKP